MYSKGFTSPTFFLKITSEILMSISEHCGSFDSNNMDTANCWAQRNGDPKKDFYINDDYHDYHGH